ncbi:MAG: maleylpyruvate isomerase family mycothiol-dependent enzyme, partial [Acidimicrobiales bacterium]|nr:maleylpyruvate isomerase family mycothiol-dependent enzyme [Acidimicrobiales bacterium]
MEPLSILADLRDEYDRLDRILDGLSEEQWHTESGAPGWTVCDVVMHLATSEEGVVSSIANPEPVWTSRDGTLDDAVAQQVARNRSSSAETFARWRAAADAALSALAEADPDQRVRWAAAPLRPLSLATTR